MAIAKVIYPINYENARAMLGDRDTLKIGHNTILSKCEGEFLICYHGNGIIKYTPKGVEVSTAGWDTVTTTGRIHAALNVIGSAWSCGITKGVAHLQNRETGEIVPLSGWVKVI